MTKEQEILSNMKKLGLTREEAEQLWEDDREDFIGEEGEAMEQKAKSLKRHYEKGEKPKHKSTSKKERKIDLAKKELLENFATVLPNLGITEFNMKTETEISFSFQDSDFTLKLVKHRKEKAK